ncbi:hypothetical protein B9T33_05035 [Acinetobacter sp. ANC 5054]|uniref:hypothetical protein n=1 Tax=Acinetobacter sp. ANC 5054 TaxID=1977877 RepID=UPI000A32F889|nr:hypothetical protein [Acinetobacter sp. ANC 5054]OTG82814.1 hypothetical protein B9T33_05035 [Acinetobacter sp. ANC 5054]
MSGFAIDNHSNAFSIATLMYARLRRVSGRVVDALYMVENTAYAHYVAQLALDTSDAELARLVARLYEELKLEDSIETVDAIVEPVVLLPENELYANEPTAEDIYKAQVSHRYIGALR